jgi:hypothetical protein
MPMDNRNFSCNYSLLAPLLIGIFSMLGICLIIMSIWFPRQNAQSTPTQTVTPFKYLLLATETVVPTLEMETAVTTKIFPTPTSRVDVVSSATGVQQNGSSPNGISTDAFMTASVTITPDPIFAESKPMSAGRYDDTYSEIIRNGNWKSQENVDSYQKTLLISNTVSNSIAFSFIGSQMVLGYQSKADAGEMTVNIDGEEVTVTQLVGNAWFSEELEPGTHFVILIHANGASVNLDYIDISG